MVNQEVPQLPLEPDHSRFHPSNLVIYAINGLAQLETWRQQGPERVDAHFADRRQHLAFTEAAQINLTKQRREIDDLRLVALVDPERYTQPLNQALNTFHLAQAEKFGSHIAALETEQPPLTRVRKWFAEKRQDYHRSRAQKAANVLLRMD